MFFSKKKEEPANDKLDALKKQLLELKAKEAELDKKSAEKAPVQTAAPAAAPVSDQIQQVQPQTVQQPVQQAAPVSVVPMTQPVVSSQIVSQPVANTAVVAVKAEEAPTVVRDREIEKFIGNVNGVVLEIGSGMSINVPVKPRMHIDEFIKIAEHVKALSALNFEHRNDRY